LPFRASDHGSAVAFKGLALIECNLKRDSAD
jgi:hypothetical protein